MRATLVAIAGLLFLTGCGGQQAAPAANAAADPQAEAQAPIKVEGEKANSKGIIGKYTQDVGEFDPDAPNQKISDSQVTYSNPITGAAEAYVPITEKIAKINITSALRIFQALHNRYPKDHEEFMTEVIKANGIRLPKLPADRRYMYDVENHELVVAIQVAPEKKAE